MGKKDKCLETEIIQGNTPGARTRARPKTNWLGNIMVRAWTMEELPSAVEVRQRWKMVVHLQYRLHDAVNPRTEDD